MTDSQMKGKWSNHTLWILRDKMCFRQRWKYAIKKEYCFCNIEWHPHTGNCSTCSQTKSHPNCWHHQGKSRVSSQQAAKESQAKQVNVIPASWNHLIFLNNYRKVSIQFWCNMELYFLIKTTWDSLTISNV